MVPERDVAVLKRFDIPVCEIYPTAVDNVAVECIYT